MFQDLSCWQLRREGTVVLRFDLELDAQLCLISGLFRTHQT